jgi:superfamily II DNA or RNA helicase
MEITEKWLGEIGGWQALKAARGLYEAGHVSLTVAEPGLLRGLAGGGKVQFASGLRIRSRTDVETLCTCPSARRGLICEHALAVALVHLKGAVSQKKPAAATTAEKPSAALVPLAIPGRYEVFFPENLLKTGQWKPPLGLYVKFTATAEGENSLLAAWLAQNGLKAQSAPLSLPASAIPGFLQACAEHPRLHAGKPSGGARELAIAREPRRLLLQAEQLSNLKQVKISQLENQQQSLPGLSASAWWLCQQTGTIFQLPPTAPELLESLNQLPITRPLTWLVQQREALAEVAQLQLSGPDLQHFRVSAVPCDYELRVDGSLQVAELTLHACFQSHSWLLGQAAAEGLFPLPDAEIPGHFYTRAQAAEARLIILIESLGFRRIDQVTTTSRAPLWRLTDVEAVLAFHASELPRLRQHLRVTESERWQTATRSVARITPQLRVPEVEKADSSTRSGRDWLSMEFSYEAPDGFRLARADVLRLVRSGQRSVKGKDGRRYVVDLPSIEAFEQTLQDVPVQITPEGAKISAWHLDYFIQDGSKEPLASTPLPDEAAVRAQLGPLADILRPYQLLGTRWLLSLARAGRGGVLGDDMGLGKTVQSIAALCALRAEAGSQAPALIICPKSLTGNWLAEIQRFAPHLKAAISQGANRSALLENLAAYDVIITTYQLCVRDEAALKAQPWSLLLLDEASYIRNPDTDAAKAVRSLRAQSRLALTGTPVENSVRDLWSIYHFVMPGYLGTREQFKERFEQPIQTSLQTPAGLAASERLKKLLRPYFLRRMKQEVLKDLPEKIEQILWCEPSPAQAEVYRRLLEEGREEIKAARKRSGQGGAKMTMFTVLLRLRQACCDLRLTGLSSSALKGLEADDLSGKWPMLQERLDEITTASGKVLIFSQFVQYLSLVRQRLDEQAVNYAYLDGSSQDREAQVAAFQKDPQKRVFLISLKAGGYGLNLTAADHVILLDPWWNPAVEAQAIDRAHRFGQQKVVNAYRLALRGTVEERILALQAQKRGLIEATLDEQSPLMAGLTEGDLESLLTE